MKINIQFTLSTDLDKFYDTIVNDLPSIIRSAHVQVEHKRLLLETDPFSEKEIEEEKILLNDIKQYMRDNEISHEITV